MHRNCEIPPQNNNPIENINTSFSFTYNNNRVQISISSENMEMLEHPRIFQ